MKQTKSEITRLTAILVFVCAVCGLRAQQPRQERTVRIKTVEHVNGVKKEFDTTFTIDGAQTQGPNASGVWVQESEMPPGAKKTIVIGGQGEDVINVNPEGEENGSAIVIRKAVGESGAGNSPRIMIIENRDGNPDTAEILAGKPLGEADKAAWNLAEKGGQVNEQVVVIDTEEQEGDQVTRVRSVTIRRTVILDDATPGEIEKSGLARPGDAPLGLTELHFSPNPSDGKFRLEFYLADKGDTEVKIVDGGGRHVYGESLPSFTGRYEKNIDISSNPKGVYFLSVSQAGRSQVKKILVN